MQGPYPYCAGTDRKSSLDHATPLPFNLELLNTFAPLIEFLLFVTEIEFLVRNYVVRISTLWNFTMKLQILQFRNTRLTLILSVACVDYFRDFACIFVNFCLVFESTLNARKSIDRDTRLRERVC